ncbi:MAG: hypothetical protein HFE75_06875 [Firmicutes bacterium]|nr:hypothetical protein [Bacillota bacterium]NBI64574.1 hypothetical protein [Clostridiales bacterium]
MERSFGAVFFPIYDRKMVSGEITFGQLGLSKEDFTRICTEKDFVPDQKTIEKLCEKMGLADDEAARLLEFAQG